MQNTHEQQQQQIDTETDSTARNFLSLLAVFVEHRFKVQKERELLTDDVVVWGVGFDGLDGVGFDGQFLDDLILSGQIMVAPNGQHTDQNWSPHRQLINRVLCVLVGWKCSVVSS